MAKRRDLVIGGIILLAFIGFVFVSVVTLLGVGSDGSLSFPSLGKRIALIDVDGPIYSSKNVVRQIKKYTKDKSVSAILVKVNSPGGGVAASQDIYRQLERARDEGKVVVVSMGAVAASGGLYLAMAADTVVAQSGTLTGSIGVIMEFPTMEKLAEKIGIRSEVVKSGALKNVGSIWHSATEDELAHLQSVIDDTYEQFLEVVARGRRMDVEEVRPLADGRIFTGRQAFEVNLVDVLGDYEDALEITAEMVGLDSPPKTVKEYPRRRSTFWDLFSKTLFGIIPGINPDGVTGPQLMFLYR